jgi:hypothetical protein
MVRIHSPRPTYLGPIIIYDTRKSGRLLGTRPGGQGSNFIEPTVLIVAGVVG